jgi:hypothetical protein
VVVENPFYRSPVTLWISRDLSGLLVHHSVGHYQNGIVQLKVRREFESDVRAYKAIIDEKLVGSDRRMSKTARRVMAEELAQKSFDGSAWEDSYSREYDRYKSLLISTMGPMWTAVWTEL